MRPLRDGVYPNPVCRAAFCPLACALFVTWKTWQGPKKDTLGSKKRLAVALGSKLGPFSFESALTWTRATKAKPARISRQESELCAR